MPHETRPSPAESERTSNRLAFRVGEFCDAMRVSRSHVYQLIKQGKLKTVTLGGRRLIPVSEAQRLLSGGDDDAS